MSTQDLVDNFNDLDVAEPVKTLTTAPITLPTPGPGLHMDSMKLASQSLVALLSQKKQVGVFNITPTMNAGSHVSTINFDMNYITFHLGNNADLTINAATKFFSGFRCSLKLIYEVTSQFQQQGALILNAINMPSVLYNNMFFSKTSVYNLCKLPRRFITLGHDGVYEVLLPWESNLKFWPFTLFNSEHQSPTVNAYNLYESNGQVSLRVFSPLKIAENVTDFAQVRIYAQLENLELCVYNPLSNAL